METLDETEAKQIEALIPNDFAKRKNHGKREQDGTVRDIRVDAGGMGPQLEELRRRFYEYLRECHVRLLD